MRPRNTYQLRLPEGMDLRDLKKRIYHNLDIAFQESGMVWKADSAMTLGELVRLVFDKHIVAYDVCGDSLACDEDVSPSSWNFQPNPHLISSDPRDRDRIRRYHLVMTDKGLDAFGNMLARLVLRRSGNAGAQGARKALKRLRETLRYALGPYLFYNPMCGDLEICRSAKAVDPWEAEAGHE